MGRKIALTGLYIVAGPLFVLVTLIFYEWTVTGGLGTAAVVSIAGVWSVWKPEKKQTETERGEE